MIHVGTAATMNYSQWTCLLLGTLRWALAGWGRTQQPGEHIQLLGGVSSFQVSLEHLLLQSERGHREFWWDLAQMGLRDCLPVLPEGTEGLGAQLLPHLLPSSWPVQVASFHLQQLMMSLVGSTLPSAQGALVLVMSWMDGWNMGCAVNALAAALSHLAPGWKALQKDLQLVN